MDCAEFSDPQDDHGEVPSGLLCSEASSLSDRVVNLLGDALEEHRMAVTHKLGLSSGGPLSEALYEWCQLPGSTVFVLRAVLVDIGRKDLAEKLVNGRWFCERKKANRLGFFYDSHLKVIHARTDRSQKNGWHRTLKEIMLTMSLYVVVEDADLNTNNVRRQFFTVTTHCDVTLASALESFLHLGLSRYRIIGPEDWVSWSTPARDLKGRQLTLRYVASKTDKAVYGCNSDTGDSMDVKGQAYKANFHAPVKGLSELKGLTTIGVEGFPIQEEKTACLKRAQTMPTFFNIPPGDHDSDMLHAIQDLKQPAISPALSSESVMNNMAAMNTLNTQSPTPSMSLACQGESSYQGMSLTLSSIDDQLTIDSTHVKVPVGKKTPRRHGITEDTADSGGINNDCASMTELKTRKETNTGQVMTIPGSAKQEMVNTTDLSVCQRSLSNNNLQAPDQMMEQNQLSGPSVYKQPQKDTKDLKTNTQQPSTPPIMNAYEKNNSYLNTRVKSVPTFANEDVGFKELNESMELSSDDCSIPVGSGNTSNNDLNMSSSIELARRYNRDPESDSTSNIYTPFSAMISPLSGHDGSHELDTDLWNEDSSAIQSESDTNNVGDKILACKSTHTACPVPYRNVSNGKHLALQEQDRKLRQITSYPHQVSHGADRDSADFKMNFLPSKPSPFVHTPPPPLYSQEVLPPSYLDVTSFQGQEIFPWGTTHQHNYHPGLCHQHCNCNVSHSHSQPIAHIAFHKHQHTSTVPSPAPARSLPIHTFGFNSFGQGRDIAMQTPPTRRHFPPFSDHVSSVSEPPMRHPLRQMPQFSNEELGGQNVEYLTPVNDAGDRHHQNLMHHGIHPMPLRVVPQPRRNICRGPLVDDEDYSYIEPGLTRQNGHHQSNLQIPNRAPPPPPRPQMSLEDQLAKVNGWCPGATDATIERIMKDYRSENGYYIVWKSQAKNRFVISVSHKHELHHFLIEQRMLEHNTDRCLYYIYKGGFSSESLLELVNHYITWGVKQRLNDSPIGTKAYVCEHIPLRRPLRMRKSFSVDS